MQLASLITLTLVVSVLWAGEAPPPVIPPAAEPGDPKVEPVEPVEPPVPVMTPVVLSVNARGGGTWSPNDKDPSKLFGGVDLAYEGAEVACDRLAYWQTVLKGAKRSFLDHARIDSGPDGRDPDHVIFDSRKATLPKLGFRGLMTPVSVEVVRQPVEPLSQPAKPVPALAPAPASTAQPSGSVPVVAGGPAPVRATGVVPFRVLLHQLGDFSGELQTASGWAPYAGWSDEAELVLVGDVVESGVAQPRFRSLVLTGRPTQAGQPRQRARLQRLKPPVADPAATKKPPIIDPADPAAVTKQPAVVTDHAAIKLLKPEAIDWAIESMTITVTFTSDGRMDRVTGGIDTVIIGTPGLDTQVEAPDAGKPR